MAYSFKNVSVTSSVSGTHVSTGDLGNATFPFKAEYNNTSLSVTKEFTDNRTVATTETLDVTSGLTDFYGVALNFATVKQIIIVNHAAGSLTVGGGSNPLINQLTITAGGCLNLTTNITTSGSVKNLVIAGSSAEYDIIILGS